MHFIANGRIHLNFSLSTLGKQIGLPLHFEINRAKNKKRNRLRLRFLLSQSPRFLKVYLVYSFPGVGKEGMKVINKMVNKAKIISQSMPRLLKKCYALIVRQLGKTFINTISINDVKVITIGKKA